MQRSFHLEQIIRVVRLLIVAWVGIHVAGCSDAASKASKLPTLNVVGIFPMDQAKSVSPNTAITATFNQEMDTTTFADTSLVVRGGGKTVTGVFTYKNMQVQIKPASDLALNTEYAVEITTALKARSGQALDKPVTWKFVTGPVVDNNAPSVVDTLPVLDATNISTNTKISVSFSERIDSAAVSAEHFSVKRGDVAITGTLQASEFALSFSPSAALAEEATYTVILQGVTDLAGNALASAKTWSFTTGKNPDTVAPLVVLSSPSNGADNLPATFSITVQMSEALDPSTITPNSVAFAAGGEVVFTTVTYASSGNSIVVTPQKSLNYGASHTLTLNGVADASGNQLALVTLSFKTEADTDGDLMPDSWEKLKGTDPTTADSNLDPDIDNLVNLDEFRAGTDPKNSDTDGDGTRDGDEVQQARNPLLNEPAILSIINGLLLSD